MNTNQILFLLISFLLSLTVSLSASAAPPPAHAVDVNVVGAIDATRVPVNICGEPQSGFPTKVIYTVPADKVLLIEFANLSVFDIGGEDPLIVFAIIKTVVDEMTGAYLMGEARIRTGTDVLFFDHDSRHVVVYADPDTEVTVQADGLNIGSKVEMELCLSGRLLPVP